MTHILGIAHFCRVPENKFLKTETYSIGDNIHLWLANSWHFLKNEKYQLLRGGSRNIYASTKSDDRSLSTENLSSLFIDNLSKGEEPFGISILYNKLENSLCIARNPFGTVPLFFIHIPQKFFAFSSSISQLISLKEVQPYLSIDSIEIYNYLATGTDKTYNSRTSFSQIKSVLPGHYIKANDEGYHLHLYQTFNPGKWDSLATPQEFGEEFRSIFLKSISQSVHNFTIVGSHLSGGLDSSSVSSAVHHLFPNKQIHTFYANTKTQLAEESYYALEVANQIKSQHHSIDPGNADLEKLILSTSIIGQPERSPISPAFHSALISQAQQTKCDVLLTGHDGDSIVGHGRDEYISQLFVEKEWEELKIQLNNVSKAGRTMSLFPLRWDSFTSETKQRKLYELYFYRQIVHKIKTYQLIPCIKLIKTALNNFGIQPSSLIVLAVDKLISKLEYSIRNKNPRSIHSQNLKDLYNNPLTDVSIHHSTRNLQYLNQIIYKQNISINEEYFALSRHYNVEVSHPFFHVELYELCLAVPPSTLFNNGVGRSPLREAMIGILPESVRNRTDKASFSKYSENSAIRLLNQSRDYLNDSSDVWLYVDKKKFNSAVKSIQSPTVTGNIVMRSFVNRTIYLAIWLHLFRNRSFIF